MIVKRHSGPTPLLYMALLLILPCGCSHDSDVVAPSPQNETPLPAWPIVNTKDEMGRPEGAG